MFRSAVWGDDWTGPVAVDEATHQIDAKQAIKSNWAHRLRELASGSVAGRQFNDLFHRIQADLRWPPPPPPLAATTDR